MIKFRKYPTPLSFFFFEEEKAGDPEGVRLIILCIWSIVV